MASDLACPEGQVFHQFLLGRLPAEEVERLAPHVECCPRCLAVLQALRADDRLLETLRDPEVARADLPSVVVEELILKVSRWELFPPPSDTAVTGGGPVPDATDGEATQEVYDFLAPPQGPGEIGRLGPYRVLKVLGVGGMGVVFQAEDIQLRRPVALKTLKQVLAASPSARRRFLREARAIAGIAHDHIVTILQVGEADGFPFLAMPLLAGETLDERLKREGKLSVAEVLRIGREIAEGLAAAHGRGVIHRDIKPSNIWLETRDGAGRAKILDFGLARAISDETYLTQSGVILGTPAYMAPEQAHGEGQDARCDLFSLGVVLYHMGTGELPFKGANTMGILRALEMDRPKPPHLLNRALPPALSHLILSLLAKAPQDRPPSALAVAADLEAIRDGRANARPSPRRWYGLVAGVLLLAAVAVLGYQFLRPAPPAQWPGFGSPQVFATGRAPIGVTTADLNGDGFLDLVVTNHEGKTVSVLLGKGDGTFHEAVSLNVGARPHGVVVVDVNGDGKPDLVVANGGDPPEKQGTVCVLLGDGRGGFADAVHYEAGFFPVDVAAGDFNGDGKLDLVVTAIGSQLPGKQGGLSLLLGNGDGTFRPAAAIGPASAVSCVVVGDFNGDGQLDLAVTHNVKNTVGVLLGNGDGTFQSAREYPVADGPQMLAAADLNGDGKLDLVATSIQTGTVSVLLGNGDGTLQPAVAYEGLGKKTSGVVAGDFNRDGKVDLVVASYEGNALLVLLGKGDGFFQEALRLPTGSGPQGLVAGDFNRDGALDVAAVHTKANNVGVFLNLPGPVNEMALGPPTQFPTGLSPTGVAVADLNRDGRCDVVATNHLSNNVSVFLGNGDGTLRKAGDFDAGLGPVAVAVGDFNGDGKPDLAVANQTATVEGLRGSVSVLLGKGDGTFHKAVNYPAGPHPAMVAVGDFNGDGKLDLAVCDNFHDGRVSILLGNGDGTFQAAVPYATGVHTGAIVAADFNGDGKLDLAVTNQTSNNVSILLGKGDGTFRPAVHYPVGTGPVSVALGDFNGDGKPDLAVANSKGRISILLGKGDGTFRAGGDFAAGRVPFSVVAADLDGDGKLDLAVANVEDNSVSFLRGNGDGTFRAPVDYPAGSGPRMLAVADVNRDGRLDLVVTNRFANRIAVLLNRWEPKGPSR